MVANGTGNSLGKSQPLVEILIGLARAVEFGL
jgi:hypothetical protein